MTGPCLDLKARHKVALRKRGWHFPDIFGISPGSFGISIVSHILLVPNVAVFSNRTGPDAASGLGDTRVTAFLFRVLTTSGDRTIVPGAK